jgi:hypothetical protein
MASKQTGPTDYEVTEAMIVYGGSFVSALGKLFRLADSDNEARLKAAFPEYWQRYAALSQKRASEHLAEGTDGQ